MITVTLIYADGRPETAEVDPGIDPYPLTIYAPRLSYFMTSLQEPSAVLQRTLEDLADGPTRLQGLLNMSEEEHAAYERERFHIFELVDPTTLRYEERHLG